jgi:hypothetical protein
MINFDLEIWHDETNFVTFYTVRKHGQKENETNKFFIAKDADKRYKTHVEVLLNLLIFEIGNEFGALPTFFTRSERAAAALPPKEVNPNGRFNLLYYGFPLRLYCLRITDSIVILFGGGLKTAKTAQKSPDLVSEFNEAQYFCVEINKLLENGSLQISPNGRQLLDKNGKSNISFR